ncbi:MAG: hypothetical protein MAG794_00777 [Gammaproteobacteria bacterium]|nr:hypothetical protein [Gammaproteobacteria bacterium]
MRRVVSALSLVLLVVAAIPAVARTPADKRPVEQQVEWVADLFVKDPLSVPGGDYAELFDPSFLNAVPEAQLTGIFVQYYNRGGRVLRVEPKSVDSDFSGSFNLIFEKGIQVPVKSIRVKESPPHLIIGLLLGLPEPIELADDMNAIASSFAERPGEVSFAATEVSVDGSGTVLGAHMPESPMAIGSAFKLYVLGRLTADVEAGERSWSDVVDVREAYKSLPSGITHKWPEDAPVTLHTLGTLMISISDNTAADHLVHILGRERIENFQAELGHSDPGLNRPLLTTREMFMIKSDSALSAQYAEADASRRRSLLGEIAEDKPSSFDFLTSPTHIDDIEWFASANDLTRAMMWFLEETPARETARAILAVNPGLDFSTDDWSYIGFKGGSESGVLNMTFLLESADGRHFVLTAGQNNPEADVDPLSFSGVMKQTARLLAQQ